ncbi:MAG: PadR family transcriptional regulator [Anaerolineae bacterium]|jgi:PadR family transcriptional regulator, regulatory protein PadR|nr:PadR family transcriptional regulator [Anaerolineae bacterium]MBT7073637.1 PadR family transcriptional regulator [Anaerolineae bacterium]MBT7782329.1 PadR family transcriptional regulator [Anaerolineae bacterium]
MPRGQRVGRRRGGGQQKTFFLQTCLLVLLHREPGYGYSLMDGLHEFGFETEKMDISIIYRALRNLEAEGLVSDSWDTSSLGPKRRVYAIAAGGEEILSKWIENLRQRRKEIENLEAAYDAVKSSTK